MFSLNKVSGTIVILAAFLIGFLLYRTFAVNVVPADGDPRLPRVDGGFMVGDLEEIVAPVIHTNFGTEFGSSTELSTDATTSEQVSEGEIEVTVSDVEVVVENLTIPWDVVFLPKGNLLVSERDGSLVEFDRETGENISVDVTSVTHVGEGGLLGITLHPDFENNHYLYVYRTGNVEGKSVNQVVRYAYRFQKLTEETIIIENIPGAFFHNGGRIAFGPDGLLYVATGDAQNAGLAQDTNSLAGKILRVTEDGRIPESNPFDNEVYSYGHRNPQGLTWDEDGALWSTEHGRSGAKTGLDELNIIFAGSNYGWPESQGDTVFSGTFGPKAHSGPDVTWAPASAAYLDGSIFFGGLRGETLYEAVISGVDVVLLKEHFTSEFGRIRTVVVGPDGMLYMTTSNRDGRGEVRVGDDRILRVHPDSL